MSGFTLDASGFSKLDVTATSIGNYLYKWFGDELPMGTGENSSPYVNGRAGYKSWTRGVHATNNWFSHGPYETMAGPGSLNIKVFMVSPTDKRSPGKAFSIDFFDFTTRSVVFSNNVSVSDLPANSDGFLVRSLSPFDVIRGHQYEVRVMAGGAADLELHLMRWEVSYV